MWRKLLLLAAVGGFFIESTHAQVPVAAAPSLEFIENRGQWPEPVRYSADIPSGRLFLEPGGLTYSLLADVPHAHAGQPQPAATTALKAHALRVTFEGGAPQPALKPETQTAEVRHYLRGNDPKHWARNVPGFRELRYAGIWPGIGAHFYENQNQQLEYDFELAANAQPAAIQLRYDGADALRLTSDGSLEISTSVGIIRELAPKAWQTDATGHRREVSCAYVLDGQTIRFQLGTYDRQQPLTIDPTVVFSTYTGATNDNWGFTATYDAQGNMYSGGIVFGPGYPTTVGAYQTSFNNVIDIGIIKYNTATTGPAARVWATYLGGSQADFPHSLVVGSQGDLFMLGTTSSLDYPTTTGAYDRTYNGGTPTSVFNATLPNGSDLVVTRLSNNGSTLGGSTFVGGSANDGLLATTGIPSLVQNYGDTFRGDIQLDANDNIYIASNSASTDFPVSNGLGRTFQGGGLDAVVCKLNATASTLLWSSFLGGSGTDAAYSLQLGATGNVYVSGGTSSTNFPTTAGTLNPTARGGIDGFVARISQLGTLLEKSTYLGTTAYDQAYFVQLDASGAVYLLGQSLGSYPVTAGRYQNPGSKQFIHKLDADLSITSFSTVFGSGRSTIDISPTAFLVDQCNRIYVSGWGGSTNQGTPGNGNTQTLPITTNAVQSTTDGNDFYLLQLAPDATRLDYATYFGQNGGGDHVDGGTSRFDPRGVVYQAVCACGRTSGFPIPPGAGTYSTTSGFSNCNNAAFKIDFETVTVIAGTNRNVCVASAPQPLLGSPAGGTWTGPGVSGSVATGFVFTPTPALLGIQTLTYTVTGVGPCGGVSTLQLTVVPSPSAAFTAPTQTSFCISQSALPSISLAATPAGGTFSGPGVTGSLFNPNLAGPGTHILTYTVNSAGCILQTTQTVTIVRATTGPAFTVCSNGIPTPLTGSPVGGVWSGPGVSGSIGTGFVFTPTAALVGTQSLTYTITGTSGCTSTATLIATVQQYSTFTPPTLPGYCITTTTPISLPGSALWSGPGVRGPSSTGFTFTPSLAGTGTFSLSYTTGFGPCDISGTIPVTISSPAVISLPPDTILCPGTTQAFRLRATPAGGTWTGPNVSSTGVFTPPAGFTGSVTLTYAITTGVCTSAATRRVSVAPAPTYAARWEPELCAETRQAPLTVRFSDPLNNFSGVRWDFGDGTQGSGNNVTHVYTQPGRYTPRLTRPFNNGLCAVELDLPVVEVTKAYEIPNIITPNGDPKNEYFRATNGCPAQLQVFSRWGNKVFEAANYQNDWNGGKLPNGVYYYLLRQADGTSVKGWLEISR
ncbi:gliding motility-associated C-terminal domain-containing protein [Hymenobacter sp. BT186]|uniref:Gliding motility-associated C-terminal domain-containing protein n=1 Tax=Hymenobacter telluris TaxID=2816474 RepID=A0A939ETM6_9BACT|nr:gliding motility-associated C-terminal domain-containing protein [Hymenobacter telluris]MBO0357017.1 gliding motility-associated C-terminal domain-containing protein [Hymenobacter telluris]MBW3373044.1 gliding motility-associated C-terminal domain-containing protein [Hymenobacter norwichensis]